MSILLVKSISHLVLLLNIIPIERLERNHTWEIVLVVVLMFALAVINIFWNKKVSQIIRAFASITQTNLLMKEENILYRSGIIIINILFLFCISFFLFKSALHFEMHFVHDNLLSYIEILVIVTLVFSVKTLTLRVTGIIFKSEELFEKCNFNLFLLNNVLGLAMLPVLVGISFFNLFNPVLFIYLGIGIIVFFYFYLLFRGYSISRVGHRVSLLYIILYICTLEILPLVVLSKVIKDSV